MRVGPKSKKFPLSLQRRKPRVFFLPAPSTHTLQERSRWEMMLVMKLELSDVLTSCAGQVPGCQGATKMARAPRFPRMAPILGSLAPWYNFQVELALIWGQQSKLGCFSTSHVNSNRSTNYTTFKQIFLNIFVRPAYKNSRGRFQIREPA